MYIRAAITVTEPQLGWSSIVLTSLGTLRNKQAIKQTNPATSLLMIVEHIDIEIEFSFLVLLTYLMKVFFDWLFFIKAKLFRKY